MWEAIKYVSSGLTLVAFIVAVGVSLYRKQIVEKAKLIRSAPDKDRALLIAKTLEFLEVDINSLTKDQQYQIALVQIHKRARRFAITAWVIITIAALTAVIAIVSMVQTKSTAISNQNGAAAKSSAELIATLELRAAEVERWFVDEKAKQSKDQLHRPDGKREQDLDAALAEFRVLHRQHLDALRNGQFVVAHEVLVKIHELLDFYDAGHYLEMPDFTNLYPGAAAAPELYNALRNIADPNRTEFIKSLYVTTVNGVRLSKEQLCTYHVALFEAAAQNDVQMATALLGAGYDVNAACRFKLGPHEDNQFTALMVAAWMGHREVLETLLTRNADWKAVDSKGRTASMLAEEAGHPDISRLLKNTVRIYIPADLDLPRVRSNPLSGLYAELRYDEHLRAVLDRGGISHEEHEAARAQIAVLIYYARQYNIELDFGEILKYRLKTEPREDTTLHDLGKQQIEILKAKREKSSR